MSAKDQRGESQCDGDDDDGYNCHEAVSAIAGDVTADGDIEVV